MHYLELLVLQLALLASVGVVVEVAKENEERHGVGKDSHGVSSGERTVDGQVIPTVH